MTKIPPYQTEDFLLPYSGDGELFVRHFSRGEPKLHFLLVHGAVEHSGRHMDLVNFWLKNYPDVAVTVFDHVGHGRSGGTRAYVESFHVYVEDFLRVCEFSASRYSEGTQNFICAHSLGGLITLTRLLDPAHGAPLSVQGLILSSPCIRPRTMMEKVSLPLLDKLNRFAPKLHIPTIYSGKDLTRDVERANDFDTDPLIPKFITTRMAKEVLEASNRIIGLSYYLSVPSLFLIAGQDKIVDPASSLLFAHGIDKRLTEIIEYPDHYHELWNEVDRFEIFSTMKEWVNRRMKETP